ncbi:hypothetical protein V8E36_007076 [Tilletia maclaganii]
MPARPPRSCLPLLLPPAFRPCRPNRSPNASAVQAPRLRQDSHTPGRFSDRLPSQEPAKTESDCPICQWPTSESSQPRYHGVGLPQKPMVLSLASLRHVLPRPISDFKITGKPPNLIGQDSAPQTRCIHISPHDQPSLTARPIVRGTTPHPFKQGPIPSLSLHTLTHPHLKAQATCPLPNPSRQHHFTESQPSITRRPRSYDFRKHSLLVLSTTIPFSSHKVCIQHSLQRPLRPAFIHPKTHTHNGNHISNKDPDQRRRTVPIPDTNPHTTLPPSGPFTLVSAFSVSSAAAGARLEGPVLPLSYIPITPLSFHPNLDPQPKNTHGARSKGKLFPRVRACALPFPLLPSFNHIPIVHNTSKIDRFALSL